ncbi:hypothetical protein [Halorubellus sp. PRR65]|uniref:hypothetical protein n=1 Tax=Halorubellus sp. PRR65 TaxID=3098148 RepID=UPI002B25A129|nr:hypothetical protein [Halorubellus sp. PRR65]
MVSRTTTTDVGVSRYDVALGVIPVLLALPALAAALTGLPVEPLVGVGAVACALVVVDVCFLHPPGDDRGIDEADDGRDGPAVGRGR